MGIATMQKFYRKQYFEKMCATKKENRCIFYPCKDRDYSGFTFSEERWQTAFYSMGTVFKEKYKRVQRGESLHCRFGWY